MPQLRGAVLWLAVSLAQHVRDTHAASCTCYTTNSTALNTTQTYTNYQFIDFRSLPANGANLSAQPALVSATQDDGSGNITSSYFTSGTFTSLFAIQNYTQTPTNNTQASTVKLVNSPQNVYISQDTPGATTQLTLRTARLSNFSSCAEIDSVPTMQHASYRARARITGAPGAVAGIFVYKNDTSESDIEILTDDPHDAFRASNQPDVGPDGNEVPGASTVETPAGYAWDEWNDYRLDWSPAQSAWYINGVLVTSKTYGVPSGDAMAILNMWSNGGSWSGNMTVGDETYLDVQWVELVYNTSSDGSADCSTVCSVDKESQVGQPVQNSVAVTAVGIGRMGPLLATMVFIYLAADMLL